MIAGTRCSSSSRLMVMASGAYRNGRSLTSADASGALAALVARMYAPGAFSSSSMRSCCHPNSHELHDAPHQPNTATAPARNSHVL